MRPDDSAGTSTAGTEKGTRTIPVLPHLPASRNCYKFVAALNSSYGKWSSYFSENTDQLPTQFRNRADRINPRQASAEYIAGMTDRFCSRQYQAHVAEKALTSGANVASLRFFASAPRFVGLGVTRSNLIQPPCLAPGSVRGKKPANKLGATRWRP